MVKMRREGERVPRIHWLRKEEKTGMEGEGTAMGPLAVQRGASRSRLTHASMSITPKVPLTLLQSGRKAGCRSQRNRITEGIYFPEPEG